jgi:tetratricopeptide (TPR) repeat protein
MATFKKGKAMWIGAAVSVMLLVMAFSIGGCELINPTNVRNPQTTEESLKTGGTGATIPFMNGVKFRYSDATEDIAYFTDTVSDNYDNVATFISPEADKPRNVIPRDLTLNGEGGPYFEVQELRALADFALTGVIPNDPQATAEQRAEATFYRGMANLLSAENYAAVPVVEDGPAVAGAQLLQLAIDDFNAALAISQHSGFATRIDLVLARAYRQKGDVANAETAANAALASGPANFAFPAQYDAANNVNDGFTFAVSRNLNDIQPLPRLDFLDPKYIARDTPISSIKMEEAHLILAEVALSRGNVAGATAALVNAINLAKSRGTTAFRDIDPRNDTNPLHPKRPTGGTVQASPTAPAIAGLIVARPVPAGSTIPVPTVSGTSLDAAVVGALADAKEIFRTLYLARQEIFFFEGRRMCDLGIRLPVMEREIETNDKIAPGDLGTVAIVPAYIPAEDGLDAFTTDVTTNTVIATDMNQVLADNKVSPFPMPF